MTTFYPKAWIEAIPDDIMLDLPTYSKLGVGSRFIEKPEWDNKFKKSYGSKRAFDYMMKDRRNIHPVHGKVKKDQFQARGVMYRVESFNKSKGVKTMAWRRSSRPYKSGSPWRADRHWQLTSLDSYIAQLFNVRRREVWKAHGKAIVSEFTLAKREVRNTTANMNLGALLVKHKMDVESLITKVQNDNNTREDIDIIIDGLYEVQRRLYKLRRRIKARGVGR